MKHSMAVVAYPLFDESECGWVESFRAINDPQSGLIAAHFTLVFPTDLDRVDVGDELAAIAASAEPFSFALRSATAVRNSFGPGGHVFLVADEGADKIVALHDRLYQGAFRPSLRSDIPYVPHITIGADSNWTRCEVLATDLNRRSVVAHGHLHSIALVEVCRDSVTRVGMFPLGP